jgi:NAD(P)H dehydrogenase (quinone)
LAFTGFAVVEPFVVFGPARISQEERRAELVRYRERVLGLASAPAIATPNTRDYDERLVLKSAPRLVAQ